MVKWIRRLNWSLIASASLSVQSAPAIKPSVFLTIILLFIAVSGVFFSRTKATPFHPDEAGWISAGVYYSKLLLNRDFALSKWECSPCEGFGSLNPNVGKWLIGLPLLVVADAHPLAADRDFFAFVDYSKSREENIILGNVPSLGLLHRARLGSAVFGVLCAMLGFAIALIATKSLLAGTTVVALLFVNALFVEAATRAMTDIHYNFFLLGLAAYSIWAMRNNKSLFLTSVVCGLIAGLAFSVKITGIIIGCLFFLAIIIYRHRTQSTTRGLTVVIVMFAVSSLAIIYGLNPNFWPSASVINGSRIVHEMKSVLMDSQKHNYQGERLAPQYPQLSNLSRLLEFPLLFSRWNRQMEGQKVKFSGDFKGNRLLSIQKRLFWDFASIPFEFVFFAVGIVVCGARVRIASRNGKVDLAIVPLCYFDLNYFFVLLVLEVDWDRYFLPTVIASKILVAIGFSALVALILSTFSHSIGFSSATHKSVESPGTTH
jgi:hypothetical protein